MGDLVQSIMDQTDYDPDDSGSGIIQFFISQVGDGTNSRSVDDESSMTGSSAQLTVCFMPAVSGSGGAEVSGVASLSSGNSVSMPGGALVGGAAQVFGPITETGSGGASLGGSATVVAGVPVVATPVQVGGSAGIAQFYAVSEAGGASCSGLVVPVGSSSYVGSGDVLVVAPTFSNGYLLVRCLLMRLHLIGRAIRAHYLRLHCREFFLQTLFQRRPHRHAFAVRYDYQQFLFVLWPRRVFVR